MLLLFVACSTADSASDSTGGKDSGSAGDPNTVVMETTLGSMTIQLDPDGAPVTTENFLTYVDEGFYDGSDGLGATIFHRVIAGFVDQGGGYTADGTAKATHDPIELETGLSNVRGTISMARTNQPNSATSQFFLNLVDNTSLDGPNGYAVFGTLTDGLDTMDAIAAVQTDGNDQPVEDVVITSCARE